MDIALDLITTQLRREINSKRLEISMGTQKRFHFNQLVHQVDETTKKAKKEAHKMDRSIQAFFIGPRGQNIEYFTYLIKKAIDSHLAARVQYEMEDARHISRKMKNQPSFLDAQDRLQRALNYVLTKMKDVTPPFFSSRYFGHMIWQTTIPAIVGNFATMLYNPNNCAYEASPFTTIIEMQVMAEFAKMFSYPPMLSLTQQKTPGINCSWGHLTCGGTVANCQAFWAARNCKFLGLSIRKYIESLKQRKNLKVQNSHIEAARSVKVSLVNGTQKKLLELTAWQLLNISNEANTQLYDLVYKTLFPADFDNPANYSSYQNGIAEYSIGKAGIIAIYEWLEQVNQISPETAWKNKRVPTPKVFVSATAHYSIRKSLSLLGLGQKAVVKVKVDLDSRISISALRQELENCLTHKIPVLGVVGIVGTTEQSTVDDLSQIFKMKEHFGTKGLYYHFHADGAYGGYFASMAKQKKHDQRNSYSPYVDKMLNSFKLTDSITFDPHKTGYVPYTCGGIIYRNHRLRDNLSFSAPYIYTGTQPNMSIYGIEGSKPGSSVTSVYLSLQVLPLIRSGHGELLQRTMMNTKIFTAGLYRIKQIDIKYQYAQGRLCQTFQCFLLPRLLSEQNGHQDHKQFEYKAIEKISQTSPQLMEQTLKTGIDGKSIEQVYSNIGPDLNIVCYGLNFMERDTKKPNKSLKKYNQFNRTLIKLSKPVGTDVSVRMKDLYVSETQISRHSYGQQIFQDFLKRHGLQEDGEEDIVLIRSTIMNAFFTQSGSDEGVGTSNQIFVRQLLQNGCETLLHLKWR